VRLEIWPVEGVPEIVAGADLVAIIGPLLDGRLQDGDILVVTSKIVSKAEGRQVLAADREDAITSQTVRLVAQRGSTRIVENPLGLVLAAAGVDASNTPDGTVLLLPADPDASARLLKERLEARLGVRLGVILSDTLGRVWRTGQTDLAIGAAGVRVLDDLRGTHDANGKRLDATIAAVADEIAGAADLVTGKASGMPVAVVRGLARYVGHDTLPGARSIVRPAEDDMFSLGTAEARAEGYAEGYSDGFAEASAEDA
jgi:coenzyme F420-0:L-glutamate ligase / coenzyme F420-1:gamma-L-glutamate ligase